MKLRGLILLLFVGLCAQIAIGQEFTGRVSDQSGAAVTKATVTVQNLLTNDAITTQTNETGVYTVPYLKPGQYSVTAVAEGFTTLVKKNITLEVGKTGVVNFVLKVGSVATTVTVEANVDLDLDKADRGEVVENTRVTELPLNGREPEMLSLLNAGVVWGNSQNYTRYQRPFDSVMTSLNINGGGNGNNVLQLDGVSNDSGNGNGVVGYVPPVDAVQEFKIVTNPYDAQYGRGQGGVVDIDLKSGTNQLHGDVYEFARRTWLDADTYQNDWLRSTDQKAAKGQHKLDQWGAEVDGPVVIPHLYNGRDKTFFVVQYENWHEVVPNTIVTSVPDPNWAKTGDFSNLTYWTGSNYAPVTLYDPLTIHTDPTAKLVRDPFPNNQIPAGRINSVARALLSYYPAPNNTTAANFQNDYFAENNTTDTYRNVLAKLDHKFTDRDRISLRYGYWERWEIQSANGMPGLAKEGAEPFGQHGPTFTVDWVHVISPSMIFDLRGSVIVRYNGYNDGPQNFNMSSIGWSSQMGPHMPKLGISGYAGLGNGGANIDVENAAALLPTMTWTKRSHTFHFGADMRVLQKAIKSTQDGPSFSFDAGWTQANYQEGNVNAGNSIASMLLGYPASGGFSTISPQYWTRNYFAPFVQDDWKVTHKLTLNLGLRWDFNTPIYERHNRVDYAFDTTIVNPVDALVNHSMIPGGGQLMGGMSFANVNGKPRSYYAMNWKDLQPRGGFAYALNNRLVMRGGFGLMYKNPIPGGNTYGWTSNTSFNSTYDGGKTPADTLTSPFPSGIVQPTGATTGAFTDLGNGPWFINPKYKTPGIWQYSFGFEKELLKHDTVELSYVANQSFNQDSQDDINHWSAQYQASCNIEMGGTHQNCDNNTPGYTANPFQGISAFQGSSYYTAPTVQFGNFTRPFPEFNSLIEYQLNDGRTWYNSLQLTAIHRQGKNLTLHGTWTWSKLMGSGGYSDTVYRIKNRWLDGNDFTHRITISGVYQLPFGRGRSVLGGINRVADAAIGGWELGSLFIYQTGSPWGFPNWNMEYKHNAHMARTTISNGASPNFHQIQGVAPCAAQVDMDTDKQTQWTNYSWLQNHSCSQMDFVQLPLYAPTRPVVYSGIRIPSLYQFDSNLSKNFEIHENLKAQFRLEAFNALNHPLWQDGYDNNAWSQTFGSIPKGPWGQSNLPRQVQLAIKLMW